MTQLLHVVGHMFVRGALNFIHNDGKVDAPSYSKM
jgi:hypothetical protein